uniref:leucine-rich repeat domain-containing protein n=1 Tax=Candidatus Limisoma sp. TaxID=3076476 RepID=UPI0040295491
GLTELTLPSSVTSIGESAFSGCSGLTELTLPNSVTSIGNYAFSDCSGLEKITVDRGNKRYDSWGNCNSIIETGTNTLIVGCKNSVIPNSVTSIGDCAFYGCTGLTELILPNSVRSIGDIAFTYCSGLEKITVESGNSCYDSRDNCNSIIDTEFNTLIVGCKNSVIPNSVTSIGYYAFYGCSGLTELTLPASVASIGDGAFICCSDLSKITSLAEIPPVCGSGVFDRVNKTNCELIVPVISVTAYKQAEVWNEFSNIRAFPE